MGWGVTTAQDIRPGPRHRKKRAGRVRPVLGARNGPRMEEDPVGPRHRVAGNPVGYKHGMMGQGDGAGKGVWLGRTNARQGRESMGRWERAGARMRQRGRGHGMGRETESAKQQSRGIGKLVAMEW